MHRSMRSRQVLEMGDERSTDMISSLPDELLIYILSFLSILDAVKTCALSRRWRLLFTLMSILSFDDKDYFGRWGRLTASQNKYLKMRFERFVDRVLAVHIMSPIQKFSLILRSTSYDASNLYVWITAAVRKEVRHLNVSTFLLPNALPNCLFGSQTLVSLEISTSIQYNFNVPDIVCLPSLKSLKLYGIAFQDGDSVKRFFIGCSQLKELVLHSCWLAFGRLRFSANALQSLTIIFCHGHAEIDVPHLEDITYIFTPCSADVVLKNSCSLSIVTLGLVSHEMPDPPQAVRELIKSAYNARELNLMFHSLKLLAWDQHNRIPAYSNLKSLRLGHCCLDSWKYLPVLLANSIQLETVVFEVGLIPHGTYGTKYEWDPTRFAPFSSNVKSIEVHHFQGNTSELPLLKYLLENAGVLMRLVLHVPHKMPITQDLQVTKGLSMLPKASTNCTIELKIRETNDVLPFMWL